MAPFLVTNAITVLIGCLFVISKGGKVSKNILSIILFSVLVWFFIGGGIVKYLIGDGFDYNVVEVPVEDLSLDEDYNINYEQNIYLDKFPLPDATVRFSDTYTEPTVVLDLEKVDSWILRLALDKEEVEPKVTVYIPLNEVFKK